VYFAGAGINHVRVPCPGPEIGHHRVPDVQAAAVYLQTGESLPRAGLWRPEPSRQVGQPAHPEAYDRAFHPRVPRRQDIDQEGVRQPAANGSSRLPIVPETPPNFGHWRTAVVTNPSGDKEHPGSAHNNTKGIEGYSGEQERYVKFILSGGMAA
jgi:hypothetical protein